MTDLSQVPSKNAWFFYDSLISHFSVSVFIQEFLLQISFPLLVPLFYYRYGSFFLASHKFLPTDRIGLVTCTTQFLVLYLYVFNSDEVVGEAMLMALFFFVVHRVMISTKYACLSPSEYRRIMRGKLGEINYKYPSQEEQMLGDLYQRKLQLATNFHVIGRGTAWFEIYTASKIIPMDLSNIFIKVSRSFEHHASPEKQQAWVSLVREVFSDDEFRSIMVSQNDESYEISSKSVMWCMYTKVLTVMPVSYTGTFSLVFGFIFSMIPFANLDSPLSSYSTETVVKLFLTVPMSVYFVIVLFFGGVAISDQLRRMQLALYLGEMIHFADSTQKLDIRFENRDKPSRKDMKVRRDLLTFDSFGSSHSGKQIPLDISLTERDLSMQVLDDFEGLNKSDEPAETSDGFRMPTLDFSSGDNFTAWYALRRVSQVINSRLRFRIDVYLFNICAAFIVMLIYMLMVAFNSSDPLRVMQQTPNLQAAFSLSLCTLIMLAYVCLGSLSNVRMERHG